MNRILIFIVVLVGAILPLFFGASSPRIAVGMIGGAGLALVMQRAFSAIESKCP